MVHCLLSLGTRTLPSWAGGAAGFFNVMGEARLEVVTSQPYLTTAM